MNKLGFTKKEALRLTFGEYIDFYEVYKKTFNFEKRKDCFYELSEEKEKVSMLSL